MFRLNVLATICLFCFANLATAQPASDIASLREQAVASMKRAATYFKTRVATHGGYVYHYDLALDRRWGEGEATRDQIWVQPPGTPAVGLAYLAAFDATGDAFYLSCVQEVGEALVYGQLKSGGWTNSIDFNPQSKAVADYRRGKGGGKNNSSLDDGQSQTAIQFLVRADAALNFKHAEIHDAAQTSLDALLAAQFPCGGFPQVWTGPVAPRPPKAANYPSYDWRTEGRIKEYWTLYTLNDNLAVYVTEALLAADNAYRGSPYEDPRYLEAVERLGDFLILSQMPQPQPAWAQQYNYDMQPVWARRFEPAAICGHESQAVVGLLMKIYSVTGEDKYLQPIPTALAYLKRSTLADGSLARYYELKSNRPLYMQRNGDQYSLTYDDTQLPDHYSWKTRSNVDALQKAFLSVKQRFGKPDPVPSPAQLTTQVRSIIDSLDAEGRWISTADSTRLVGQAKFAPGEKYLASQVFNDNLETLARFIRVSQGK
ncbi:MAG: pectate lyase [Pirellulaceae bacterium]